MPARARARVELEPTPLEDVLQQMTQAVGRELRDIEAGREGQGLLGVPGRKNLTRGGPDAFVAEFLTMSERLRKLERWQDQLPTSSAPSSLQRIRSSPTRIKSAGKKGDSFGRVDSSDSFGRPGSGQPSNCGRKVRMLPVQAPTIAPPPQVWGQSSSSALPPRLQNLFQKPRDRGMSRAEADFLTLQTYAPDWRPKHKVYKKMKRRKNLRVKPPECNSGLDERVARSPFNPFEHGAMERGSANNSYTYTFPVDHEESRGKKLGQGNNRRSKSVEPGAWQQAAQAQTDKSTDILPPPRSPPRELTREEREKFKELPRPASATVAKPEIRSRPASTHGRARSSERPASREGGVRPESSSGSEKKMSQKAVMMRLRPKLFEQSVSELGSQTSQQQKTLGCPECFHAFGGLCVQHLSTSWQGSIKQVMIEREEQLVSQSLSGDLDARLKVKIYTSAHQEHRGKEMAFAVEPEETIMSLKHRICEEDGTPAMFQRFLFRGHYLEDDSKTMGETGIDNFSQIFVVLPAPVEGFSIKGGCDYCADSLGGVCTRHLREKRGDIYPKELRETFLIENVHRAPRAGAIDHLRNVVDDSKLRAGSQCLQLFRVEMLQRFNDIWDAWIYFDMDGDGSITRKEFQALCRPLKMPKYLVMDQVFNEIDAKDQLLKLFPFTFARSVIWHETPFNLKLKSEIYRAIDQARINRSEIFRLALERSSLEPTIYAGINDITQASASLPDMSVTSSRPTSSAGTSRGCPQCDKAINGVCHRCLPVYKNGVQVLADTNEHQSYYEALQMADASKQMALHARSPSAFFELDGAECGKGTMVSVLFEDNTWHTGYVDAYNPKNFKVRIVFQDLRIGVVHAPMNSIRIKVANQEDATAAAKSEDLHQSLAGTSLSRGAAEGRDRAGFGSDGGTEKGVDDDAYVMGVVDNDEHGGGEILEVRIPQAQREAGVAD